MRVVGLLTIDGERRKRRKGRGRERRGVGGDLVMGSLYLHSSHVVE